MRIMVLDDNQINRAAAQAQLKDHDLTVVGTYDEAQKQLTPQCNYEKVSTTLKREFGDFKPYCSDDKLINAAYFAAEKAANKQATTYPNFDVVLSDLLVPASGKSQGSKELVGREMPVGIFIGLLAAVKAHVKYVAVFTDSDHHSHPASACFDIFNDFDEGNPLAFKVEDSKVILCNARIWVDYFDPRDLSKPLEYEECRKRSDTVRAKNWAALLAHLLHT